MLYRTYKKTAGRGKVAARVASVRAALSGAITNDVDKAERLDGCYRVLGDATEPCQLLVEHLLEFSRREGDPLAQLVTSVALIGPPIASPTARAPSLAGARVA